MKRILFLVSVVWVSILPAMSQGRKGVETSTDIAMFAPAAVGAGVAFVKGDYKGLLQLGKKRTPRRQ